MAKTQKEMKHEQGKMMEEKKPVRLIKKMINKISFYNYLLRKINDNSLSHMYILDLRSKEEYEQDHIVNVIHIDDHNYLNNIIKETSLGSNIKLIGYTNQEECSINIYDELINTKFPLLTGEFLLLNCSFNDFKSEFPFLCKNRNEEVIKQVKTQMQKVLKTQVFLNQNTVVFDYPFKISNYIYFGKFVHFNNKIIYEHLKIAYVYDFTSNGFTPKNLFHEKYVRFNEKGQQQIETKEKENQSINYSSCINSSFIFNVVKNLIDLEKQLKNEFDKEKRKINNINESSMEHVQKNKNKKNNLHYGILIIFNTVFSENTNNNKEDVSLAIALGYLMYLYQYKPLGALAHLYKIVGKVKVDHGALLMLNKFYLKLKHEGIVESNEKMNLENKSDSQINLTEKDNKTEEQIKDVNSNTKNCSKHNEEVQ